MTPPSNQSKKPSIVDSDDWGLWTPEKQAEMEQSDQNKEPQ